MFHVKIKVWRSNFILQKLICCYISKATVTEMQLRNFIMTGCRSLSREWVPAEVTGTFSIDQRPDKKLMIPPSYRLSLSAWGDKRHCSQVKAHCGDVKKDEGHPKTPGQNRKLLMRKWIHFLSGWKLTGICWGCTRDKESSRFYRSLRRNDQELFTYLHCPF